MTLEPQLIAASPSLSAGVRANAGTGKTWTLVRRVARLLLHGARPDAILCVTYTKAAAAEMQTRLYEELGRWSVMDDGALSAELAKLDEAGAELKTARALFARALETPGGLKIQTLHAFCEKLLRRFPLEAGLSPNFQVLDDAGQALAGARSREALAHAALADGSGGLGAAYAHMATQLDEAAFDSMLRAFSARRRRIGAYLLAVGTGLEADLYARCGLPGPVSSEEIEAQALAVLDPDVLRAAARALGRGSNTAQTLAMRTILLADAVTDGHATFADALGLFCTKEGSPAKIWENNPALAAAPDAQAAALAMREQLLEARDRLRAAAMARDSFATLTLAAAQIGAYEAHKAELGVLDFDDLVARARRLLTEGEGAAAWVLYKLDGGIDHLLLDEAQDTAPEQWEILHALTGEFFAGAGAREMSRTVFLVGDEKQSIYGFQGAAPERLDSELQVFDSLAREAGGAFTAVELQTSRRSTPQVLALVDAVANQDRVLPALQPGAAGADAVILHKTSRAGEAGCVDLWPLEIGEEEEELDYWLPVDVEPPESGVKRQARRIAAEVRRLVDAKEAGPGDVLILVRRRNLLFDEIIRALKQAGLPTAGADRLKLTGHIAAMDLLALGRVCLFPGDDLSLAAVLRSPLCDVDETSLFELAHGRAANLWTTLSARADERAEWRAAMTLLDWAMEQAGRLSPFDFYGRVLSRLDGAGLSLRQRLTRRLGAEAGEVLDEFLAETLSLESGGAVSLEGLVAALSASAVEVKREQEAAGGKVRVMTVHAAKGLEAKIVFLPDTTGVPPDRDPLLELDDGGLLWAPRKADDIPASEAARAARREGVMQESLRLLYVAMTRARDRLVVCGVARRDRKTGMEKDCWREYLEAAFAALPQVVARGEGDFTFRRLGPDPAPAPRQAEDGGEGPPLPAFALRLAPAEARGAALASPSTLAGGARDLAPSPLAARQGLGRFRRGDLIHRLLQVLPDLPLEAREAAAVRLLGREADLSETQGREMIAAALAVLNDARFAEVFGPGSRAEAAVAGASPRLPAPISGRLDRLSVMPDKVLVVDFKTNRPPPARIEEADPAYILQMAAYHAVLSDIFPDRLVEAALVWTDGPSLMPVPEKLMQAALANWTVNA